MNEYEAIRSLVASLTRYDRQYLGKVLSKDDQEAQGRVQIIIPALGLSSMDEAVWADVEQCYGEHVVPDVDDWVCVYFADGNGARPVVRGKVSCVKDNLPPTDKDVRLLYKDDDLEVSLDRANGVYTLAYSKDARVQIDGNVEVSVGGDASVSVDGDASVSASNVSIDCDKFSVNGNLEVQ